MSRESIVSDLAMKADADVCAAVQRVTNLLGDMGAKSSVVVRVLTTQLVALTAMTQAPLERVHSARETADLVTDDELLYVALFAYAVTVAVVKQHGPARELIEQSTLEKFRAVTGREFSGRRLTEIGQ